MGQKRGLMFRRGGQAASSVPVSTQRRLPDAGPFCPVLPRSLGYRPFFGAPFAPPRKPLAPRFQNPGTTNPLRQRRVRHRDACRNRRSAFTYNRSGAAAVLLASRHNQFFIVACPAHCQEAVSFRRRLLSSPGAAVPASVSPQVRAKLRPSSEAARALPVEQSEPCADSRRRAGESQQPSAWRGNPRANIGRGRPAPVDDGLSWPCPFVVMVWMRLQPAHWKKCATPVALSAIFTDRNQFIGTLQSAHSGGWRSLTDRFKICTIPHP